MTTATEDFIPQALDPVSSTHLSQRETKLGPLLPQEQTPPPGQGVGARRDGGRRRRAPDAVCMGSAEIRAHLIGRTVP